MTVKAYLLPEPIGLEPGTTAVGWQNADGIADVSDFLPAGASGAAHLVQFSLSAVAGGNVTTRFFTATTLPDNTFGVGPGPDLSPAWETQRRAIVLSVPGLSDLVLSGPDAEGNRTRDAVERYVYDPGANNLSYTPQSGNAETHLLPAWFVDYLAAATADPTTRAILTLFDGTDLPAIDSLQDDPPLAFPTVALADALELMLPQYAGSTRLRGLATRIVDILDAEAVAPLQTSDRAINPAESAGILLDWIGTRLGLPRPWVALADATYFGFRGTRASGGRPFGQAPFFTARRGIELREPIGDATYRILLRGRARRLRGGADRETAEAVLAILFDSGHLDETGAAPVLRAATDNDVLFALAQGMLFELLFPRPAGVAMTLARITT